jgi:hypothetical protein
MLPIVEDQCPIKDRSLRTPMRMVIVGLNGSRPKGAQTQSMRSGNLIIYEKERNLWDLDLAI